jgi:release factor glutamine methyltransferase
MTQQPIHQAFAKTCQELAHLGPIEASSEAWHLLTHCTSMSKTQLIANWRDPMLPIATKKLRVLLKKRQAGEPLAYILGKWFFYGYPLLVHRGVLIPRPETEILVSVAQAFLQKDIYIFELGVGTGAIPLALAMTHPITYDGWDVSKRAIINAEANLAPLHNSQIRLHHQSFFAKTAAWRSIVATNRPSILISNPPYIPPEDMSDLQSEVRNHEPKRALVGGPDGLSFYRRLCKAYLTPSVQNQRHMVLEVGIRQRPAIDAILQQYPGYTWTWHQDMAGIDRVVAVTPIRS